MTAPMLIPTNSPVTLDVDPKMQLEQRLRHVIDQGSASITERIEELRSEWNSSRIARILTAAMVLAGVGLGYFLNSWGAVIAVIGVAALFQFALRRTPFVQTCFLRFGFRSRVEIEQEVTALRVLRGDFANLPKADLIEDREALGRMENEGGPAPIDDHEVVKRDAREAVQEIVEAVRT